MSNQLVETVIGELFQHCEKSKDLCSLKNRRALRILFV